VLSGEIDEPTPNERLLLGEEMLSRGVRLACQFEPRQDLQIVILAPAAQTDWRPLVGALADTSCDASDERLAGLPQDESAPCGLAVDLGTTQISVSAFDLVSGRRLAACRGRNPQMSVGPDIMSRLVAASESPEQLRDLGRQATGAIEGALAYLSLREGIRPQQVVRIAVVGNSAMLALLSGRNSHLLLQSQHWTTRIDCLPPDADTWVSQWNIHPQATVEVLPPLGGFVGSDLLAGVVATSLTEENACSLLIDFGTNSEIALWDGRVLWVTSAAGGPAFEGSGLRCGMPAERGAIDRVVLRHGVPTYRVIAGGEPLGICGSGLVDLIAELVGSGQVTAKGQFAPTVAQGGYTLAQGDPDIVLARGDIDLFQRAKAAIGVGVQVLMQQAGIGHRDLRRICVSGSFGAALDIANAQRIGLLPPVPAGQVELCGDTALAGCERALLSPTAAERLTRIGSGARVINLAHCLDFESLFLDHLHLCPSFGGAQ
jgi:uncharacterized 2Fe-2S/4Fe-4S cluster protein (DUF4445 family)